MICVRIFPNNEHSGLVAGMVQNSKHCRNHGNLLPKRNARRGWILGSWKDFNRVYFILHVFVAMAIMEKQTVD